MQKNTLSAAPKEKYRLAWTRHFRLVHANRLYVLLGAATCSIGFLCIFAVYNWCVPVVLSAAVALMFLSTIIFSSFAPCKCGQTLRSPVGAKRLKMPLFGTGIPSFVWPLFPICLAPVLLVLEGHFAAFILGTIFTAIGIGLFLYGVTGAAGRKTQIDVFLEGHDFEIIDLEKKSQQELHGLLEHALRIGELERADLLSKYLLKCADTIELDEEP